LQTAFWKELKISSGTSRLARLLQCSPDISLHNQNRHLPQLVPSLLDQGAPEVAAASLLSQITEQIGLKSQQMHDDSHS